MVSTAKRLLTMASAIATVAIIVCAPLVTIADDSDAEVVINTGGSGMSFEGNDIKIEDLRKLDTNATDNDICRKILRALNLEYSSYTFTVESISDISKSKARSSEVAKDSTTSINVEKTSFHVKFQAKSTANGTVFDDVFPEFIDVAKEFKNNTRSNGDTLTVEADYTYHNITKIVEKFTLNSINNAVVTESTTEESTYVEVQDADIYCKYSDKSVNMTAKSLQRNDLVELRTYDFLGEQPESVSDSTTAYRYDKLTDACYANEIIYKIDGEKSRARSINLNGPEYAKIMEIESGGTAYKTTAIVRTGTLDYTKITANMLFSNSTFGDNDSLMTFMKSVGTVEDGAEHVESMFDDTMPLGKGMSERNKFLIVLGITAGVVIIIAGICAVLVRRH